MMTIADSFRELLARSEPPGTFNEVADARLQSIRSRLGQAFDLRKFETVGSYARGTFIRTSSDLDVFAVISRDDVRWGDGYKTSTTVLNQLRQEMEGRFWNTTVYRDAQAVVVGFQDCSVDIVPAFYSRATEKGWPVYYMPDRAGDWMESSPSLHNQFIAQEDAAAGGKLRGTARLLKFWRHCRTPDVAVSSFHIEMILASDGICKGAKSYAQCTLEILQRLAERGCRALQDPLGVSGYIAAVRSEGQLSGAVASVRYSRDHASAAVTAEARGDLAEARRQWDIVFNGQFPW